MNTSTSIRYHFNDYKWAIFIFYMVLLAIILAGSFFSIIFHELGTFSGVEFSSSLFIWIAGMNSFKSVFLFHIQSGSTRKTLFKGWFCFSALISVALSILNTLIICSLLAVSFPIRSPMLSLEIDSFPLRVLVSTLLNSTIHFLLIHLGYFISLSFYRLGTLGKYLLAILIGNTAILVSWSSKWEGFWDTIFLYPSQHPLSCACLYLIIGIFVSFCCWLMLKNAPCQIENTCKDILSI